MVDSLPAGTEHLTSPQLVKTTAGYLVTYSRIQGDSVRVRGVGGAATSADGITWHRDTLATNAPILIEPCADGNSVTATYISNGTPGLWTTSSSDGGATWTAPSQVEAYANDVQTAPGCARRGATFGWSTASGQMASAFITPPTLAPISRRSASSRTERRFMVRSD